MGVPSTTEAGLHETTFALGGTCREEFQCVRDRDQMQLIYPAVPHPEQTSIPIKGPNEGGAGKRWLVKGAKREEVRVQIRIGDAHITLTVASGSDSEMRWESRPGLPEHDHYITSSLNNWDMNLMTPDAENPNVSRYRFEFQESVYETFQIVVDA